VGASQDRGDEFPIALTKAWILRIFKVVNLFGGILMEARSLNGEKGASLVEYALLVALIAVACIVAIRALGTRVSDQFSTITSALS